MVARSVLVKERLEQVRPIGPIDRVLEIGPGANGLIFFFDAPTRIGVDPLAADLENLFPTLAKRADVLTGWGEALPFPDGFFDVVLCENVLDQTEDPARVITEGCRVLAPGGLLYLTVDVYSGTGLQAWAINLLMNAPGRWWRSLETEKTVLFSSAKLLQLFAGVALKIISTRLTKTATRSATPAESLRRQFGAIRNHAVRLELIAQKM